MNGIRCPKCDLVNLLAAEHCARCSTVLSDLPPTAQVSVPVDQMFQAQQFAAGHTETIPQDNELGRKTYFWYRVYCAVLVALYVFLMGLGVILIFFEPEPRTSSPDEDLIVGLVYIILGALFALVFLIAIFLPRKPYNWIVGIVMIAFGMTSCCFLPATLPLLIFWLKPETKAFFGRK
ncbi:MAG: hypothetical protein KDB79_06165 [Acidobacteria bacterium]|nr:hypothetical protein [Acidobacteriota bacterium]